MRVELVRLVRVAMPLVQPFRTSFGVQQERDVLLVHVVTDVGEGWGECASHAEPFYNEEFTEASQLVLQRWLAPAVLSAGEITGSDVAGLLARVKGYRAAKAGLEMAVLDAELRAKQCSLAAFLGATRPTIEVGVSVGIAANVDELLAHVDGYVNDGYGRVKLKIMRGWDVEPVAAVRRAFPNLALQVDANAGYEAGDLDHLVALDAFGLVMIEQPFGAGELEAHSELAKRLSTPLCLDESILSAADATRAIRAGACRIVNVKVGRVGGVLAARAVRDACAADGVPVWCGGMLETGIGRAANIAVAALDGFDFPADISASRRYWERDLTEPFSLVDGGLEVPTRPGLGVEVETGLFDVWGAEILEVPGVSPVTRSQVSS